jgi:hypothetical protein
MRVHEVEVAQSPNDPQEIARRLEHKVQEMFASAEQSELWQTLAHPDTPPKQVAAIMKYLMLEVFSYGPLVVESTFRAIGRMPNTRLDLMRPIVSHLISEVGHGEMALKDFIKLGGDEAWARTRQMTSASYAMGATCRMLAERENPFGYLGYMYLFESVTPIMAERVQGFLQAQGFPVGAQRFIDEHAEVDIKHSELMTKLVVKVVHDFPEAGAAITFAADCFAAVYPLPIWATVMANVRAEMAGQPLPG